MFLTFFLETYIFSTIVQPYILQNNSMFGFKFLDPNGDHNCLITLFSWEQTVVVITEFIKNNYQCLFPPILSCLNELMSMNILYPGLLGTCFCFYFGTFACLIFTCVHTSHGSSFPVNFIPMVSAVVFRRCSPACPVIWWNFQIGILFPGSVAACA